jgi:hypothetical protein
MSIFKYILSPFVEFTEPDKTGATKQTANVSVTPGSYTAPAESSASQGQRPLPTDDSNNSDDLASHFEKLIEEANQKNPLFQGTDLKEYLDTKVELNTISNEADKIRTAFNVLKRTGLTKDKLLTTGREYIKLIEHDLAGIEGAFAQQYKNDVELKEQQMQAMGQEKQALIEKINTIDRDMAQLVQQISQSKDQLTNNKNQFILAGERKKSEIETELTKINQYL